MYKPTLVLFSKNGNIPSIIYNNNLELIKSVDKKFSGIYNGFRFLDFFLDQCKKIEKKEIKHDYVSIFDYRNQNDSKMLFDGIDMQEFYNNIYIEFLYEVYFIDIKYYVDLRQNVINVISFFDLDNENTMLISKLVLRSFLGCFYVLNNNNIAKNDFIINFEKNLNRFLSIELSSELSKILLDNFISSSVVEEYDINLLKLSDSCFFWHLKFMSLSVVKIYDANADAISYNCKLGMINLPNVLSNFLLSRDIKYADKLKDNYIEDKKFFDFFIKDFFNLNGFMGKLNSSDTEVKNVFMYFFFEKLIINSYCFHVIISSCFEKYFFAKKPNILYDKNPSLRLNY